VPHQVSFRAARHISLHRLAAGDVPVPEWDELRHRPTQMYNPFGSIDLSMETEVAQNV